MPVESFVFTTGAAQLDDVGTLSYNGCTFSPLFQSDLSCVAVKDAANRTVKYLEFTLTADGYVTSPNVVKLTTTTSRTMVTLSTLLTAQAGVLQYKGRGFDIAVNEAVANMTGLGASISAADVMWGPVPEMFEFQTLGGGLSAKVKWQVKFRIPNIAAGTLGGKILQFNYETVVSYGEDGFSGISVKGTMETGLTRAVQTTRTLQRTVDNFRIRVDTLMAGFDLSRFRVTRRNFNVSRDKRTMEFDIQAEEKSYMDLPPACTVARGTFSLKPAKTGLGLVTWLCSLRATYTVRADAPRRWAWFSFLALLRLRMSQSRFGSTNPTGGVAGAAVANQANDAIPNPRQFMPDNNWWISLLNLSSNVPLLPTNLRTVFLCDFSVEEGLYNDSKTTSFSATWRLNTTFQTIMVASGLWRKLPERDAQGKNLWATAMSNVQGSQSWLRNRLDPALDVIVDFGS